MVQTVEQNCLHQQNKMELQRKDFQYYFLWSSDMQVEGIGSETSLSKGSQNLQFALADRSTRILPCAKWLTMACNQTHRTCGWYEMNWPKMSYTYMPFTVYLISTIWIISSFHAFNPTRPRHKSSPCTCCAAIKLKRMATCVTRLHATEPQSCSVMQPHPDLTRRKSSSQPHSPKMKSWNPIFVESHGTLSNIDPSIVPGRWGWHSKKQSRDEVQWPTSNPMLDYDSWCRVLLVLVVYLWVSVKLVEPSYFQELAPGNLKNVKPFCSENLPESVWQVAL